MRLRSNNSAELKTRCALLPEDDSGHQKYLSRPADCLNMPRGQHASPTTSPNLIWLIRVRTIDGPVHVSAGVGGVSKGHVYDLPISSIHREIRTTNGEH